MALGMTMLAGAVTPGLAVGERIKATDRPEPREVVAGLIDQRPAVAQRGKAVAFSGAEYLVPSKNGDRTIARRVKDGEILILDAPVFWEKDGERYLVGVGDDKNSDTPRLMTPRNIILVDLDQAKTKRDGTKKLQRYVYSKPNHPDQSGPETVKVDINPLGRMRVAGKLGFPRSAYVALAGASLTTPMAFDPTGQHLLPLYEQYIENR